MKPGDRVKYVPDDARNRTKLAVDLAGCEGVVTDGPTKAGEYFVNLEWGNSKACVHDLPKFFVAVESAEESEG